MQELANRQTFAAGTLQRGQRQYAIARLNADAVIKQGLELTETLLV